jgi:hypothetical protein
VWYDSAKSNASTHFADTPGLQELVVEVLQARRITQNDLWFDIDLHRIIGTTDVVAVDSSDEIVYAIRTKRFEQGYVPFTKSRPAQPSSYLSVSLIAEDDESYSLSSAWIGAWDDPPFPQESHATAESKEYWNSHAFVWGSQAIEPGSEMLNCPW